MVCQRDLKGYIAEAEFERFIEEQFRVVPAEMETAGQPVCYVDPIEHPLGADLFQLFDFYLEVPGSDTFVAVDMKNWARSTDRLKKEALQEEAAGKYDRLRALLPDRRVKAVYVNLYGAHKFLVNKNVNFMSLYVQTRRNGVDGWMVNENLINVLLGP